MSAMPIGAPGWPLLAFCTASMLRARMALARSRRLGIAEFSCGVVRFKKGRHFRPVARRGQREKTAGAVRRVRGGEYLGAAQASVGRQCRTLWGRLHAGQRRWGRCRSVDLGAAGRDKPGPTDSEAAAR